jgi:hypothetical protein
MEEEAKGDEKGNDIDTLKQKVDQLEKAVGQLVGLVQAQQKLIQSMSQPQQVPNQQAPQMPQPNQQNMAQLMTTLAPLLQLFQPKGSKLEEIIISKALDGMLGMYDLNKGFMQALMESLASSFGKRAGEKLGMVVVNEE